MFGKIMSDSWDDDCLIAVKIIMMTYTHYFVIYLMLTSPRKRWRSNKVNRVLFEITSIVDRKIIISIMK